LCSVFGCLIVTQPIGCIVLVSRNDAFDWLVDTESPDSHTVNHSCRSALRKVEDKPSAAP